MEGERGGGKRVVGDDRKTRGHGKKAIGRKRES